MTFFSKSALAKETLPTRPQNIKNISTIFETVERVGVRPAVKPTVLIAETVSSIASESETPSTPQMIKVAQIMSVRFMVIIRIAFLRNSVLMVLPQNTTSSLPRTVENAKAITTSLRYAG